VARINQQPGLLENLQQAVTSLTADEEFQLFTVLWGTYNGEVALTLHSETVDITFQTNLRTSNTIYWFFTDNPSGKFFYAKYFLPALNINITTGTWEYVKNLEYGFMKDRHEKYQVEIEYLLEKTGYLNEIRQLCAEIKKNLPQIKKVFDKSNIDETIRLYSIEFRKHDNERPIFSLFR
jgi:hypothetical protein